MKYDGEKQKAKVFEALIKSHPNVKIKWQDSSVAEITDNTRNSINSIIADLKTDKTACILVLQAERDILNLIY